MFDNWSHKFIRSLFSEPDGTGSISRVSIAALISFVVGAGVALLCKVHYPVSVEEFNSFLVASGEFIVTTCGPLYLINKGASVLAQKSGKE